MYSLPSLLLAGSYLLQNAHALPHPQRSPTTWLVVDVNGPAKAEQPGVTTIYHTMLDGAGKATPAKTTVAIPITIAQARPESTMKSADQPDDGDWFTFDPQPSAPGSSADDQTTETLPPMTDASTTASRSASSGTKSSMTSAGTSPSSNDMVTMTMAASPSKGPHSYDAISSPPPAPKPTARPAAVSSPPTTAAPHIDSTHATLAFLMDPPHAAEPSESRSVTHAKPMASTADATDKAMKTKTITTALLTMPCVETGIASMSDAMAIAVPTAILMPDVSRLKNGPHAGPHVSAFAHQSSTTRKPYSATYTAKWAASAAATKKTKAAAAATTTTPTTATPTAPTTDTAVGTTTAKATTTSDLYPVTSAWKTLTKSSTAAGHGEPPASSETATAKSEAGAWWAALQSEAAVAFAEANPKQTTPKAPSRRAVRRSLEEMECGRKTKGKRPTKAAR